MKTLMSAVLVGVICTTGTSVWAQAIGGDATVTTPSSPTPGTALPHADEKMPSAASSGSKSQLPEYSTLAAGRVACGQDTVVWVTPVTRTFVGSRVGSFGKTARGFYACRSKAMAAGLTQGAQ